MNEILLSIAGLNVTAYGAGVVLAVLVFLAAMYLACRKQGLGYGALIRYAVIALPLAFICARVVYALASISYYVIEVGNPVLMLHFWDGGYSAAGALMGLLLAAPLSARWAKASCGCLLDAACWAALPALAVERAFEPLTGMGLGRPFTYDWMQFLGVDDGYGELVHPVYRYEIALALIILLAVTVWGLRRKKPLPAGDLCMTILALLGSSQAVLESLRADGHMIVFHFVRVQQILFLAAAVIVLIICVCRLARADAIKKSHQLLLWLVVIGCIGLGIFMEFRVDRGALKLLYYGVITLCMGVIAALGLICRSRAEKLA